METGGIKTGCVSNRVLGMTAGRGNLSVFQGSGRRFSCASGIWLFIQVNMGNVVPARTLERKPQNTQAQRMEFGSTRTAEELWSLVAFCCSSDLQSRTNHLLHLRALKRLKGKFSEGPLWGGGNPKMRIAELCATG